MDLTLTVEQRLSRCDYNFYRRLKENLCIKRKAFYDVFEVIIVKELDNAITERIDNRYRIALKEYQKAVIQLDTFINLMFKKYKEY